MHVSHDRFQLFYVFVRKCARLTVARSADTVIENRVCTIHHNIDTNKCYEAKKRYAADNQDDFGAVVAQVCLPQQHKLKEDISEVDTHNREEKYLKSLVISTIIGVIGSQSLTKVQLMEISESSSVRNVRITPRTAWKNTMAWIGLRALKNMEPERIDCHMKHAMPQDTNMTANNACLIFTSGDESSAAFSFSRGVFMLWIVLWNTPGLIRVLVAKRKRKDSPAFIRQRGCLSDQ